MSKFAPAAALGFLLLVTQSPAHAADMSNVVSTLQNGGYVIVFRHGPTDNSQQDVYPFKFEDMKAQRQLSEKGRDQARQVGAAIKALGIPLGEIYTSRLNRAVETGRLMSGKEVVAIDDLTDSGAGNPSAMANPAGGGNAKLGQAMRDLLNTAPKAGGTNTILITHKTNIADGLGKEFGDVAEGEASIFKPNASGAPIFVVRVHATEWIGFTPKQADAAR